MRMMVSINPSTNEVLGEVPMTTAEDVARLVKEARQAQVTWRKIGLEARIKALRPLVALFTQHQKSIAEMTSREMGQPINLSSGMVERSVEQFNWNLDHAPMILKNETTYEDAGVINEVIYEPRGVIACIMAWNFPIGNFVYSVSQALIAGNVVVVKYSEEVPLVSKLLESICAEAGLPKGVLSFVHGDGQVGAALADQPIDMILFTGSASTGQKLYAKAAEKLIPTVMELGGSSPGLVFPDADLPAILRDIFFFRFRNCGQFCGGLKRLIVHRSLFAACVEGLGKIADSIQPGDPLDPKTDIGPLVAERQVVKLEEQIKDAVDKGATIISGGKRPSGKKGAWFQPTILANVTTQMRVWTEEVFGPALPIVSFDTYEEAIALANDTPYGLTSYVFTQDKALARQAASDITAGCVGVNGQHYFRSENPFGGIKQSGIGRENGKWGFHEVCNIKIVARPR